MAVDERRIAILGAGKIGEALLRGLLSSEWRKPSEIVATGRREERIAELAETYGVEATLSNAQAVAGSSVVVIAVKPQDFFKDAEQMRPALDSEPLLISIMAGVRLETILAALPAQRAVRVMPNLGATVGESFSTWFAVPSVTEADRALVRMLLGAVGREQETAAEGYIDMASAVAGSGPGYITLLLEALIDGAVTIGLPRALATEMVLQTMLGSLRWAQADGRHPAELRAQVVSPGGTTAEGVLALEQMMRKDEPVLSRDAAPPARESEAELRAMMRDPRYWRQREPEFVRRVTEGFRRLVGTNG